MDDQHLRDFARRTDKRPLRGGGGGIHAAVPAHADTVGCEMGQGPAASQWPLPFLMGKSPGRIAEKAQPICWSAECM